jgi:aminoglycoside phosphotransferase (APT) family kinase protein
MTTPSFLAADTGTGTPPADVEFSLEMLAGLLADQHADLIGLPLKLVASGWDNWMVRVGDDLCARLPRRAVADALILSEQTHLPRLSPQLPVAVPTPVRTGQPGRGYPYHWSIVAWLPGETVASAPLRDDQGPALAAFLRLLHAQLIDGLPANPARNGELASFDPDTQARLARQALQHPWLSDLEARVWRPALALPPHFTSVFLHGDLHARNVLSLDGRLSAVIDWGDLTADDPMFDLAAIWHLLEDASARKTALDLYGADAALTARAMAWAFRIGLLLLDTGSVDSPQHAQMGLKTLNALAVDGCISD